MLSIYNTLTKQKEVFKPISPNTIKLYVCGITVYDYCHLGHARVWVAFDSVVRFLRATGWQVEYVRNITDIDDKIIKRANQNNESFEALTGRFIEAMQEDEKALGIVPPNQEPRATHHIESIIALCKTLEEKGLAYVGESGDLYFAVDKFATYGELAHKDLEMLQAGSRVELVEAKRNPLDFVLWKMSKEGEPAWESPWGNGRPGWHIECSAMSTQCLGNHFDIHGGGHDLIFPHHENERAQSEGATGETFVNTWMHVGFVQVNKEKMSKSLNNFFTVRDILKEHDGETIRFFLMSSHYRSPLNYDPDLLKGANESLMSLYTAIRDLDIKALPLKQLEHNPHVQAFIEVMNDDFNTPKALSLLFEVAHEVNTARQKGEDCTEIAQVLLSLAQTLGLLTRDVQAVFQGEALDFDVEGYIEEREQARKDKNWARADEIRQFLLTKGVVLEDTAKGTYWRRERESEHKPESKKTKGSPQA